jgi:sialic acid synthase SpsE
MNAAFKVGTRTIGADSPCFIIAEIGINHNGKLELAKKLIDAAADAGCDAVKFQTFVADRMYPHAAGKVTWQDAANTYTYTIRDKVKTMEMPLEWIPELKQYAEQKGVIFFSSACDEDSADALEQRGIGLFKIPSPEITHLPLLEHVARKGKPVILSTGGATLEEIRDAYAAVRRHTDKVAILHCVIKYPVPLDIVNMNVLNTLRMEFPDTVIGYSDHTAEPSAAPVTAIVKGAKIIEKHITLGKKMEGPDHFFALEPQELKQMVADIRAAEKNIAAGRQVAVRDEILGSAQKTVSEHERYLRSFTQRRIFAVAPIRKGERLTPANLAVLRPGEVREGLEPKHYFALVSGYCACHDIKPEEPITWERVEKAEETP